MTHRLVQISFMFPGVPKVRDLEPAFNAIGDDWIRISSTNWLMWTDKTSGHLAESLFPYIDRHDNLLVAAIGADDFMGRQPYWVWEWLRSKLQIVTDSDPNAALLSAFRKHT